MSLNFKSAKKTNTESNPYDKARNRVKFLNAVIHGNVGFHDHIHEAHEMDIDKVDISIDEGNIICRYPISKKDDTLAQFSYVFPPMVVESVELRAPGYKSEDPDKADKSDNSPFGHKFNVTVTEHLPIADIIQKHCPDWLERQKKAFKFQEDLFRKIATFIADDPSLLPKFRSECGTEAMNDLTERGLSASEVQKKTPEVTKRKMIKKYHNVMSTYAALDEEDDVFKEEDMSPILKMNPRNIKISIKSFVENKTGEAEHPDVEKALIKDKSDLSALKVREAYTSGLRLRLPKITANGKPIERESIFDNPISRGDTVRVIISPWCWTRQSKAGLSAVMKTVDVLARSPVTAKVEKIDNSEYLPKGYDPMAIPIPKQNTGIFGNLKGLNLKIAEYVQKNSIYPKTCTTEDLKNNFPDVSENDLGDALNELSKSDFVDQNEGQIIFVRKNVASDDQEESDEVANKRKAPEHNDTDSDRPAKKKFRIPGDSDDE